MSGKEPPSTNACLVLIDLLVTTQCVPGHPTYLYCSKYNIVYCTVHCTIYFTVNCTIQWTLPKLQSFLMIWLIPWGKFPFCILYIVPYTIFYTVLTNILYTVLKQILYNVLYTLHYIILLRLCVWLSLHNLWKTLSFLFSCISLPITLLYPTLYITL